jgi:hypothetical protein
MHLAHRALQGLGVLTVAFTELTVLQGAPTQVLGLVFLPQQHERDALAREFTVHGGELR